MYRIGEFSYLCETTVKTLRHYDKIGLLKPIQVDDFTGYRYYSDEQKEKVRQIKKLQQTGFSLNEIKNLLENPNNMQLSQKEKEIIEEEKEKIKILHEMKVDMKEKGKVELINNPNIYVFGKYFRIRSRKDQEREENKIKRKLLKLGMLYRCDKVFINFEKTYKENDICCFIGGVLPENDKTYYRKIKELHKNKFDIFNENKITTMLYTKVSESVTSSYQDIIKYANENNIQIRGWFWEVYRENNEIEIYVEAYDLNKTNEDEVRWRKEFLENVKDVHEKRYVGRWKLQGEITELPSQFNPRKKHYMPETKFTILELHEDGTTNFENIIWKDKYLIEKRNNIIITHSLYIKKKGLRKYLEIFVHEELSTNARPYHYYYKKCR